MTKKLSIDSEQADATLLIANDNVALTVQHHQLGVVVDGGTG